MRYIGIDFGDARVGVACSDPEGKLATARKTITVNGIKDAAAKTADAVKELDGEAVVLGMPKNMDGTLTYRAERTERFADMLRELTGTEVILFDERLSTAQAHRYLNLTDYGGRKRKKVIDALSAQIILQDYLDFSANKK